MPIIISTLLNWIASLSGRFLVDTSLRFIAYKTLAVSIITVLVPHTAMFFLESLFEGLFAIANSSIDTSSLSSPVIEFFGMGAYIAHHMMFADCLSIIVTALVIRFVLNFIPFVG